MTMNCQQIVDLLVDYLDGDLAAEQEQRLEEHLESCPPCVKFIDSYRSTSTVCRRALTIEMPGAVKSTLFDFLRTELTSTKP